MNGKYSRKKSIFRTMYLEHVSME